MKENSLVGTDHIRHSAKYYFMRYFKLWLAGAVLLCLALATATSALTTISQSYSTNENLPLGSIVSLQSISSDDVVAASSSNVDNLFGVIINADNSLLSLSNGQENQVQVATSGTARILVSDVNGTIYRGDHITASPISGVGMKATGNIRVIGIAQSDMSNSTASKQSYTDNSGQKHTAVIGEIPILVGVSYYFKQPDKTVVPSALQNIANALAGKTVDTLPILISAAIFLVTVITVASMIYSMIRSSIISVGRNPMSQSAVYRNMVQLLVVVLVILGIGFASIYMVLTRL